MASRLVPVAFVHMYMYMYSNFLPITQGYTATYPADSSLMDYQSTNRLCTRGNVYNGTPATGNGMCKIVQTNIGFIQN